MHTQYAQAPEPRRPAEGEAPFAAGEVFFSRTDTRGVIRSGNEVFRRVADFDWQDLLGAPHKIIRHPEMPRGVFHVLWDRLLKGQPVGAYVQNKARDGLHYWVFAVVTPCEGGFLSARLKPTSARLATVKSLYAALLSREQAGELTPETSAGEIETAVQGLGFDGYDDFAADSLSEELLSEAEAMGGAPSQRILAARSLLGRVQQLATDAASLQAAFLALTAVPRNLQIKAKMLEPTGGPLTALSSDYGRMSHEMSERFNKNVIGADDNFGKIAAGIKKTLLHSGTREILRRCNAELSVRDLASEGCDAAQECETLADLIHQYSESIALENQSLDKLSDHLSKACKEMRRALLGLNTVRVTGKIENARLTGDTSSLREIIAHLGKSQERVEQFLEATMGAVDEICLGLRHANRLERGSNESGVPPVPERRRSVPA